MHHESTEFAARFLRSDFQLQPDSSPPELSSRTRPRFVGTAVRDLLFQRRNHLRDSESSTRVALTDRCISEYSLDGWKDSTWVWEKQFEKPKLLVAQASACGSSS